MYLNAIPPFLKALSSLIFFTLSNAPTSIGQSAEKCDPLYFYQKSVHSHDSLYKSLSNFFINDSLRLNGLVASHFPKEASKSQIMFAFIIWKNGILNVTIKTRRESDYYSEIFRKEILKVLKDKPILSKKQLLLPIVVMESNPTNITFLLKEKDCLYYYKTKAELEKNKTWHILPPWLALWLPKK